MSNARVVYLKKAGFYETEDARVTEQFGQIAHALSTYESRHGPGDAEPFQRFWQGEDEKNPHPEKYLKK